MDINLNFVNLSNDVNNSQIVIFQKNVSTDFDELAIAWKVITNCGRGDNHPFVFPMLTTVSASDADGNYMPQKRADNGQVFNVSRSTSGNVLALAGPAPTSREIQLRNDLSQGAITASVFKDNRLLAHKTGIVPGQKAVFEFKPTLWIGTASQIEQGAVMNSAVLSDINTELSLLGIKSADIVMTGGGGGTTATAYQFRLANVVMG
ncbi:MULTISPECIES: hypothetical protein [Burkholderia]|uniref:Aromatic ring-opening dioxygenase LigA n=1 Tax=Burkholderia diffusa TaxID=488732 RepID=A0A6P2HM50_9BURK|nr:MULTISPECIES: hypothetical protein [Burkholderia]AOI94724.1 aromatic ring-opening dioxygenase LigA [Burkholderia sp. LA-2-3-30-S1-D2]AOJ89814.1 aromatic ring-opening dioxygenase LigA [Burkholderia sp. MSMB0856]KAB0649415.1 hypothetical protein F7R23_27180 [Burkholderia diffusa]KVE17801.1 aromatic ring-opening dioxygenase LigA [Burkholderia sp. LA-2-3-30-S1-D2]KVF68466.1 aromatic ring-opening dioxygenase LigA [Burkholderia sp. FL-7-2-10-S1-D7]